MLLKIPMIVHVFIQENGMIFSRLSIGHKVFCIKVFDEGETIAYILGQRISLGLICIMYLLDWS